MGEQDVVEVKELEVFSEVLWLHQITVIVLGNMFDMRDQTTKLIYFSILMLFPILFEKIIIGS